MRRPSVVEVITVIYTSNKRQHFSLYLSKITVILLSNSTKFLLTTQPTPEQISLQVEVNYKPLRMKEYPQSNKGIVVPNPFLLVNP